MKILYLSCHSILEYDEISLLNELGHQVFSPGAYVEPRNPGDASLRPGLMDLVYDPEDVAAYSKLQDAVGHDKDPKYSLSKEFVDRFDVVIVMHIPEWITNNWQVMKHKKVVWRTIGQSIERQEMKLAPYRRQGLHIIRYSPMERNIPSFCGEDALIRFYKNPEEFGNWTGEDKRVITFAQHMQQRDSACNFTFFEEVTRPFPRGLYGPGNEAAGPFAQGKQPFEELKRLMRSARVYFYTGTHPASYTLNFMEAWMTGIPIVAIGPKYGNAPYFPGHNLYEIPTLIDNRVNGFISDDPAELQDFIRLLLNDEDRAKAMSEEGRKKAISIFGKSTIKQQWALFLESL